MEILVSILIPVYKVESTIRRCLDSVIKQTYRKLEIIIIDDGSPDNSPQICDEYANLDERIQVIHTTNGGPARARNIALQKSKGDFIVFIDSDDFIERNVIEKWVQIAIDKKVDYILGSFVSYFGSDEHGKGKFGHPISATNLSEYPTKEEVLSAMIIDDNRIGVPWGKMYDKALFNNLAFPEEMKYGEDIFLAPILIDRAKKIYFDREYTYYYSQENNSLCRSKFTVEKLNRGKAILKWLELCDEKYPELSEPVRKCYYIEVLNEYIQLFFSDIRDKVELLEKLKKEIIYYHQKIGKSCYMRRNDKIKSFLIRNNLWTLIRILYFGKKYYNVEE